MLQGLKTKKAYKVLAQCEAHIKHQVRVSCHCYQFHDDVEDDNSSPCRPLSICRFSCYERFARSRHQPEPGREDSQEVDNLGRSCQFPLVPEAIGNPEGLDVLPGKGLALWWPYLGPLAVVTLENFSKEQDPRWSHSSTHFAPKMLNKSMIFSSEEVLPSLNVEPLSVR